jgi:DNA-binding MarR family transcriptional regulator
MVKFSTAARTIVEECAGGRTRQASRMLTRVYDEELRPIGVQASQLTLLVAVAMFGESGATVGALADATLMDRTTVTRNVKPLEQAGLLLVARSSTDARSRTIVLTRAGERKIEAAYPLWRRAQERIRSAVGAGRIDALRGQLEEILPRIPRVDDDTV